LSGIGTRAEGLAEGHRGRRLAAGRRQQRAHLECVGAAALGCHGHEQRIGLRAIPQSQSNAGSAEAPLECIRLCAPSRIEIGKQTGIAAARGEDA